MSGWPTATPLKPGIETSASYASPTCCATPNTPSTPETPASLGLLQAAAARRCHWPPPSRSQEPAPAKAGDTTLVQYRADLDSRLERLLAVSPTTETGRQLARGIRKCRGDLFVFITRRDVPATNNECE